MAGYDGFSKSNNAVRAEQNGLMTATQLAKVLRCSSAAVKKHLSPSEWHHTSGHYNRTNYYDEPYLTAYATGDFDDIEPEELDYFKGVLEQLRGESQKPKMTHIWEGCKVRWIEWGGTRNHPTATEREATGCTVTWKAGAATVTVEGGPNSRKKIGSNGFEVRDRDGRQIIGSLETPASYVERQEDQNVAV